MNINVRAKFPLQPLVFLVLASTALSACSTVDRLKSVGEVPQQSSIQNPTMAKNYKPVSMPMPAEKLVAKSNNSLWTGSQSGFFKDQRAKRVGDIMTVVIDIDDKGKLENSSERTRATAEGAAAPALLGLEAHAGEYLADAINPANLAEIGTNSSYKGDGTIDRKEKIEMKLAATVTQVLPNGNLVIQGTQEVRVNYENRMLQLAGVVRPQDVNVDNTVSYEQIADARISYGGKGQVSDVQQPRVGTQVFDILMPF